MIPTGGGSNVLGCELGFGELQRAGEIAKTPKLFCAQPLQCCPIASQVLAELGLDDGKAPPAEWNTPTKTIAEGTAIGRPAPARGRGDSRDRERRRRAVRVSDEEIGRATLEPARAGLYTEPTCAQAAAAYHELLAAGAIGPDELTVVVLTSEASATPGVAHSLLGVVTISEETRGASGRTVRGAADGGAGRRFVFRRSNIRMSG